MFAKVYAGFWAALLLVALVLFAMGDLTLLAVTVLGFISCLLIFMGMICVLPTVVGPHGSDQLHKKTAPTPRSDTTVKEGAGWLALAAVRLREPHLR